VADPGVATIYNRGQAYTRAALSPDGDRSDWFAIEPGLLAELAEGSGGGIREDAERPFAVEFVAVTPRLYAAQRRVVQRIEAGGDPLEIEERASAVIHAALAACGHADRRTLRDSAARRDLAMAARAELARELLAPMDLVTLATRLGVSPWHLCRVFREQVGTTLHAYRRDLRLRTAIERLEPSLGRMSRLAFECGFSSHSHFTAAFRRQFGRPPSAASTPEGERGDDLRH
jgi:AraC-like DNA-binding protein